MELTKESEDSTGTANEKYKAYTESLEASLKRLTNAWEGFTQKIEGSWIVKQGVFLLTDFIEHFDNLVSLVGSLGGAFLAIKMPAWMGKFVSNNFGGGKVGSFVGKMLGGNDGFIGSRINTKRQKKLDTMYNFQQKKLDAEYELGDLSDEEYKKKFDQIEGDRQEAYRRSQWAKDPYDKKSNPIVGAIEEGNTFLDKIFLLLRKKLEGGTVTDEDFEDVEKSHPKALKNNPEQKKKWYQKPVAKQVLGAAGAAALTGVTAGMTKTTVGDSDVDKLWNKTGQTVEADTGDKVIKGVTTGALAAAGSIFGPIGTMLGTVVGGALGDLFTFLRHRDELERKQRVEEAKKQLEALNGISESLASNSDAFYAATLTSEDFKKIEETLHQFRTYFADNREVEKETVAQINASVQEFDTSVTSFEDVERLLKEGTYELRTTIADILQAQTLKNERDQYVASQEQMFFNYDKVLGQSDTDFGSYDTSEADGAALEKLKNAGLITANIDDETISDIRVVGDSLEEVERNAAEAQKILQETGGDVSSLTEEFGNLADAAHTQNASMKEVNEQLARYNVLIGKAASGVSHLTLEEKKSYGREGVEYAIAKGMEEQGIAVRDAAGQIKSEYLDAIRQQIREDSNLVSLLGAEEKTYGDLFKARKRLSTAMGKGEGENFSNAEWEELNQMIQKGDFAEIRTKYESLKSLTDQELVNLVSAANPDKVFDLAQALGMTTTKLEEMGGPLERVSVAMALKGASAIRELREEYVGLWNDLADGGLSSGSLEKILTSMPELVPKLKEGTLEETLIQDSFKSEGIYAELYRKQIFSAYAQNSNVFEKFREAYGEDIKKALEDANATDLQLTWGNAGNFSDAWKVLFSDVIQGNEELKKAIEEEFNFEVEYEFENPLLNKIIEVRTQHLEEQLSNLEQQKSALSQINEERKKELDLMKAQEALENAKKEKKRVYREGVGFVYEADEDAISEAQGNLEEKSTQQEEERLQMEIDRLNLEKEILEYIPKKEQLEHDEQIYESWTEALEETGGTLDSLPAILDTIYSKFEKFNLGGGVDDYDDAQAEKTATKKDKLKGALEKYKTVMNESMYRVHQGNYENFQYGETGGTNNRAQLEAYEEARDKRNFAVRELQAAMEGMSEDEIKAAVGEFNYNAYFGENAPKEDTNTGVFRWRLGSFDGRDNENLHTSFNKKSEANDDFVNELLDDKESGNALYWNGTGWQAFDASVNRDYLEGMDDYTVLGNWDHKDIFGVVYKNKIYYLYDEQERFKHATGVVSTLTPEYATINELGTEGIVTPQGTFTALPSHTGIVPADITKNVWKLGEVAPTLIAKLDSLRNPELKSNNGNTTNNDGTFIDQLNMTVYPTKDYDMEKFLAEAKAKARITRHNN